MLVFTRDDDDFGDGPAELECANGMRDYWFLRNYRKQFVESHAPAAAGRDDDGAKHEQNQKRPTPNSEKVSSTLSIECSVLSVCFIAVASALPRSAPCRQCDRRLSPATLSSPRPSAPLTSPRFQQSFRARLWRVRRRSSLAANTRLRSTIPLFPC